VKSRLTPFAQQLRNKSTEAEKILWRHLRLKQIEGCKFRRQQPIENYIVDFVCFDKRIIIEVDGGQHSVNKDSDSARDEYLKSNGFDVLRFWNNEIFENLNGVLEVIRNKVLTPSLNPSRQGREITIMD
jgi:very-short-patch-repair endonuclease